MTKRFLVVILAAAASGLLPGRGFAMLAPVERTADAKTLRTALESKGVRSRLAAFGLTEREVDSRLNRLSDRQLHQLAKDLEAISPGGRERIFGRGSARDSRILVIVLIVLLLVLIL